VELSGALPGGERLPESSGKLVGLVGQLQAREARLDSLVRSRKFEQHGDQSVFGLALEEVR
jgi:hypothetical protein